MSDDPLGRLSELYDGRDDIPPDDGLKWVSEVAELLHELAPERADDFDEITPFLFAGLSDAGVMPYWQRALSIIRAGMADATRSRGVGPVSRDSVAREGRMELLISWSGPASHALALALRGWLPTVLPFADPWVSSADIAKGKRWGRELGEKLQESGYCVACITPGTEHEPWVNFETGAIAKVLDESHVSPLLLGVDQEELDGLPLSQFQCTEFSKEDMRRLLDSINSAAGSPLGDAQIKRNLDNAWAGLVAVVGKIPLEYEEPDEDGLEEEDDGDAILDASEEDILVLLAGLGEDTADAESIARNISLNPVRTQYYLDQLLISGYVFDRLNTRYPTQYGITSFGRSYVVENDLDD